MGNANNSISTIDRVNQQLATEESSIATGNRIIGFLGFVLIVGVFGYLFWGTNKILEMTEPQMMFNFAQGLITEGMDSGLKEAEATIEKEAPNWARDLSLKMQKSIPEFRPQLEEFVIQQINEQVIAGRQEVEPHLAKFIEENKLALKDGLTSLKTSPDSAKKFADSLVPLLEQNLGGDLKASVEDVLYGCMQIRAKLTKLKDEKSKKNRIEALEARAFAIVRRMQLQQAAPELSVREPVDVKKRNETKGIDEKKEGASGASSK